MIITRAEHVAAFIRARAGRRRGGRLPKQVMPTLIENSYARALTGLMVRFRTLFEPLERELPALIAGAHADTRLDSLENVRRFDAGEGKRVRELIREARSKMVDVIHPKEVEMLAARFARETATHQRIQLGRQTRAALGADVFVQDKRLGSLMEAFVDSNVGLITKLSDEVAGQIETTVLRAVQDATPYTDLATELNERFGIGERRAELIARDQIGKFYGQTNAARQREMGVTEFVWRTSGDERVRDEHEAIDGDTFSYAEGGHPTEGLPGEAVQCRCSAEPVFDGILEAIDA